jgi:undecaprenyl-diphosphatase
MTWWQALLVGLVQGVTEWLPVSSFGHVLLLLRAMVPGADSPEGHEATIALAICLQAGAIVAVLGLYRKRILQMFRGVLGADAVGRRLALNVLVAFIPAGAVGYLFGDKIEAYLFNVKLTAAAWLVGGLLILLVTWMRGGSRGNRRGMDLEHLDWARALIIGWVQCLAFFPGTSRSLVTIVSGLVVGLTVAGAVEFSFLLGLLTLTAAVASKAHHKHHEILQFYSVTNLVLAFGMAALAAAITIQWLLAYLRRYSLAIFGWYRVALGLVVTVLLLTGALKH